MAFVIKNISTKSLNGVRNLVRAIHAAGEKSRFTFTNETTHNHTRIKIGTVRLRDAKDYCGNHPLPCPVRPGGHRPHKRLNYLEGADWVAFNDMLNDVLDKMKISADVASSLVIIRKGQERCVYYDSRPFPNGIDNEWVKDSRQFENRIGKKSKRSEYPPGTPGIPEWKKEFDNSKKYSTLFE